MIERDCGLGGGGFGEHSRGVITKGGVGMDLLHESGEVVGGIDLVESFVERGESVFDGVRAFGGEQRVDGTLSGSEAVVLDFFEGGNVRLGRPDSGLREGNALGGKNGSEKKRETKENAARRAASNIERTSPEEFVSELG